MNISAIRGEKLFATNLTNEHEWKNNLWQFRFSYWDTDDEKLFEETFEKYNDLLDSFGAALENIPLKTEETFEEYFKRIMQIIKDKRKM